MGKLLLEDCLTTMHKNEIWYNYVFCGPPDFDELGWNPGKDWGKYLDFLERVFKGFKIETGAVTVAITDRKYDGGVIEKHAEIIRIMHELGYKYISQKIWNKSDKRNLYRLNYSFVMSFGKGKIKQNHNDDYEYDVWRVDNDKYDGYSYGFPTDIVERCVKNFTNKGDTVYDCFMGSGTTAVACLRTGRDYFGSEIDEATHKLSVKRLEEEEKKIL
jgi:hypothetical protein